MRRISIIACFWVISFLLTACGHFDAQNERRTHTRQFMESVSKKTDESLPDKYPLGLNDCVDIALKNNLNIQNARINNRLANLDRKIAFSYFLPHIEIEASRVATDRQQAIGVGGMFNPISDQIMTNVALNAQQYVFAAETWFIYDAFKNGEDISSMIEKRTREQIRLQITALFFACLSLKERESAVLSFSQQSQILEKEVSALFREGLILQSQLETVKTLVLSQTTALNETRRLYAETSAALLEAMGLSPLADITLKAGTPLSVTQEALPDQILSALQNRLELYIADKTVEIRKDQVKIAIAGFLPKLAGFGNFTHSTNSHNKYSDLWTFGLSGVLTLFDGFANIHDYQAAREKRKQAFIDRENACLQIMLEVIRARNQYDNSFEQFDVARQNLVAAQAGFDEANAKWREGLLTASDKSEAFARLISAKADLSAAAYQTQVATATLLDVLGEFSLKGSHDEKKN